MIRSVLMLSPEPPYPLASGGAYRTASLLQYFARFAKVDLLLISESGKPALLPPKLSGEPLVRSQTVIPLKAHGRGVAARYYRNARRAIRGVPPLIDRLGGLESALAEAVAGRRYDLGMVEHFWCAPYIAQMESVCGRTVLDLHNVESMLHQRCAAVEHGLIGAGHRRFAGSSRKLESELLPRYSLVLAASTDDARQALAIAPQARIEVYPNALPYVEMPQVPEEDSIVFSGNFEYHPNIDAVRYLVSEIWPEVARKRPGLRLRLVGRGEGFIRHLIPADSRIEMSGSVPNALAEIAAARVVIAPLRAGSGTRIKILEAWAAGRAVVATPLAAEGLLVQDGRNIVLATGPGAFAAAIDRLLSDSCERQRLGANGRHTFDEHYTWDAAWRNLDSYLQLMRPAELKSLY